MRIVGPNGEKVDVMTFRGSFERDMKEFVEQDPDLKAAVEAEDDDAIETIMQRAVLPSPGDVLLAGQARRCPTACPRQLRHSSTTRSARSRCPRKDAIVADTVDSIAARFNLRYSEQKWLDATDAIARRRSARARSGSWRAT